VDSKRTTPKMNEKVDSVKLRDTRIFLGSDEDVHNGKRAEERSHLFNAHRSRA